MIDIRYIIILMLFVVSACDRNSNDDFGIYTGERLSINAHILNEQASEVVDDAHISTVRVIIFSQNSELVFNDIVDKTIIEDGVSFKMAVAQGENNFYIICNENAELASKLAALTHEDEIEKITFQTAETLPPLPMYGKVLQANVKVDANGIVQVEVNGVTTNSLTINVDRLLSKLNLTVIKDIENPGIDFTVERMQIRICRIPKYTTLKSNQPYVLSEWADEMLVSGSGRLVNNGQYDRTDELFSTPDTVDKITFPDIYIPEHLLNKAEDPDEATYLMIDATYKMLNGNIQEQHTVYPLNLGQQPPVNYNLTRNHHYNVYATVKGLGSMSLYAEIVPFTEYHHPVEWKPFEGYMIMSEKLSDYNLNTSIWNDYSQYYGVLKIAKNNTASPVLFRYGSIIALSENNTATNFNATTDVLWNSICDTPATWDEVPYQASGNIIYNSESVSQGKGDPCRLVGLTSSELNNNIVDNGLWRMPTIDEMKWLNNARNDEPNPNGFYSFLSLLTPKNGFRSPTGSMNPATSKGYYWASNDAQSFIFNTNDNTMVSAAPDEVEKAYAIRCIRQFIPPSYFSMAGASLSWTGMQNGHLELGDNYSIPYWKLIPGTETGITYSKSRGTGKDKWAVFNADALPNPYEARTFNATYYGYGLDGQIHTAPIQIYQSGLMHTITYELVSPTNLPKNEQGYLLIPKAGIELQFKMSIDTPPYPPYSSGYNNLQWRMQAYWYNNQGHYTYSTPIITSDIAKIVIPKNNWGHIIAVDLSFQWVSPKGSYPPSDTFKSRITFIQEK